MTIKALSGAYPNGHALSASYSGVSITNTGSVASANGAAGAVGVYVAGGLGQDGGDGVASTIAPTLPWWRRQR